METQNSLERQSNEIIGYLPSGGQNPSGGNKICSGAACGFSDSETSSKDAKERSASMRKLLMAVVLCIIFMSVEVVGGIKANSLAILTDAAHLLSDVAAFAISLFSLWASGWEANPRQSYGFFRIEILGALVSIQLIWLLTGIILYEAVDRIINKKGDVKGTLMFAVAAFGLVVNVIMAVLLGHDHGHGHQHGHGEHDHGHSGDVHDHAHAIEHGHKVSSIGHHHNHHHHHHHVGESENKDEESHHHSHDHGHGHQHGHGEHDHGHSGDGHDHAHATEHGHNVSSIGHHHNHHHHHHNAGESENKDEESHVYNTVIHVDDDMDPSEPLLKHPGSCCESKKPKRSWNINVQGAYLHVLGDSIQSVGVMIGGALIWYKPEWTIIDLLCTLVFSIIVLGTTIRMLRNILEVLMESTPREIDATRLEKGLCEMEGVVAVHELHIWAITVGKVLLACHVTITPEADADLILDKVIGYIRREYNISHVTIQIERQ